MRAKGRVVGLIFLAVSNACPALAQVEGVVLLHEGSQPVPSVRVRLLSSGGAVRQEAVSQSNGRFRFAEIGAGNYVIEATLKGHQPARQAVTVVSSAAHVVIILQRELSAPTPPRNFLDARLAPNVRREWEKAQEELLRNRPDKARRRLEKAVALDERFAAGFRLLAQLALDANELVDAETMLARARAIEPEEAHALALAGAVANRRNDPEHAVPLLEKALAREPDSWRAHFELAQAQLALKAYPDALPHAEKALDRRGPGFAEGHVLLANVLLKLRRFPEAARHFAAFLKLAPNSPSAAPARDVLKQIEATGVGR